MNLPRAVGFQGYVIRRRNYGEADRLLTLFTRSQGKVQVLARGVRHLTSKRAGHLEVFTKIKGIYLPGKTLNTLADIESLNRLGFASSLETVSYAYYACEIVDKILPLEEPYPVVYELFSEVITALPALETPTQAAIIEKFAVRALVALGYLPFEVGLPHPALPEILERISERRVMTPRFLKRIRYLSKV
jgi:DNA repair protein RecO (recombination protein O)